MNILSLDRGTLLKYKPRDKNKLLDLVTTETGSVVDEQRVKAVLRAHRDYFLANKVQVFQEEARQIVQRLGPDSTFVDLGCWTGVLAHHVLEAVTPAAYVGIDAGRWYIDVAREILPAWCKFRSFYLLPDAAADLARVDKLYFTLEDPLNTSGFYIRRVIAQDRLAAMPVGKTVRPVDFAHYLRDNFAVDKLYLKMDIEGIDPELVLALTRTQLIPQVLHFEMLERFMPYWPEVGAALAPHYEFVDFPPAPNTTAIVVAVRKGEPFAPATLVWDKATKAITLYEH